jgi:TM2 domain-containing membrane protein YozV
MKLALSIFLFIVLFCSNFAQQNYQDVVYLKNGSIIRGVIIEQVPNVSIKIETKDGNVFVYEISQVEKMTKERPVGNFSNNNNSNIDEKSPTTAFFLSFLVPGLGQYYNGQATKGIIMDAVYVTGWALFFGAGTTTTTNNDYYYYNYNTTEITTWYYVGLGMVIGSSIWSMIDAPISANNINEQRRNSFGHLLEYNFDKVAIVGIDPVAFRHGSGVSLTVHF